MNQVKIFRENTRRLEMNLGSINRTDCCCGVSDTQCFVLVEIGRKANISVKELAEILRLDKSGISRTVEELVQKGYVERKPSKEDRRYVFLNLTDKGNERFNKIEHDMDQRFKCIFRLNGTASPRQRKGCPLQTGSLLLVNSGYACSFHSVQGGTPYE